MKSSLFMVLLTCIVLNCAKSQQLCRPFDTATENLREVIVGSCTIYQHDVNQAVFCTEGFRNCTEIWEAFSWAFLYQPRCNVNDSRMERYIQLTDHSIPKDKSLFWENVYPFVNRYSNKGLRYTSVSDTLPGYTGSGPQWCSDPETPTGMSPPGTTCPGWEATPDCPQSAQRAFWVAASRNFGKRASGEIFVMLNATFNPIFANNTYFAVYELPFIRENIVTKATVLLVNEYPVRGQTMCNDPSLAVLARQMRAKRIEYVCIENRRDVMVAFCLDNHTSKMCEMLDEKTNSSQQTVTSSAIVILLVILAVIFTGH